MAILTTDRAAAPLDAPASPEVLIREARRRRRRRWGRWLGVVGVAMTVTLASAVTRSAPPRPRTHIRASHPAAEVRLLGLAERGVTGDYAATYDLQGVPLLPFGGRRWQVTDEHVGTAGWSMSAGRWSYRVRAFGPGAMSSVVTWRETGAEWTDCWRTPSQHETGCGAGTAMLSMTAWGALGNPFLPATLTAALRAELTYRLAPGQQRSVGTWTTPSAFGALRCVRITVGAVPGEAGSAGTWCLTTRGLVARASLSGVPGVLAQATVALVGWSRHPDVPIVAPSGAPTTRPPRLSLPAGNY